MFVRSILLVILIFNQLFGQDSIQKRYAFIERSFNEFYIPSGLMISGIALTGNGKNDIKNQIQTFRNEHIPNFRNKLDDYAQFAPIAMAYAFEFTNLKSKNNLKDKTLILLKGQLISLSTLYILKTSVNQTRPNGGEYSFPSGHTTNVFAGATFLASEYSDYPWVPFVAYGIASGVGIMRIANNKHYISDVLFGAGLGIASMKLAYKIHDWRKRQHVAKIKDPLAVYFTTPSSLN